MSCLQSGSSPSFIAWDERPVNTWQSVLQEAENHGKLKDVIAFARKEKPTVQSLELAEQDLLLQWKHPSCQTASGAAHGRRRPGEDHRAMSTLRPIGFLTRGLAASNRWAASCWRTAAAAPGS